MSNLLAVSMPSPVGDLGAYLRAVNAFPMLTAEEERNLAIRLRTQDDLNAAWTMVTSHLRFVTKLARGYKGYGLSQEDLIQEGNIGLMKAVRRFDPDMGVRLSSFSIHWIRAAMHEFVVRNWRIVKVATTKAQRKLFFNLRGAKKRLGWLREAQIEAVAEDLSVKTSDVVEMEQRLQATDPAFDGLDSDDGEGLAPALYLEDSSTDPGLVVAQDEWDRHASNALALALENLDERSRAIVTRRWVDEPKATLHELAEEFGVSAERVRQIEAKALKGMRVQLESDVY